MIVSDGQHVAEWIARVDDRHAGQARPAEFRRPCVGVHVADAEERVAVIRVPAADGGWKIAAEAADRCSLEVALVPGALLLIRIVDRQMLWGSRECPG